MNKRDTENQVLEAMALEIWEHAYARHHGISVGQAKAEKLTIPDPAFRAAEDLARLWTTANKMSLSDLVKHFGLSEGPGKPWNTGEHMAGMSLMTDEPYKSGQGNRKRVLVPKFEVTLDGENLVWDGFVEPVGNPDDDQARVGDDVYVDMPGERRWIGEIVTVYPYPAEEADVVHTMGGENRVERVELRYLTLRGHRRRAEMMRDRSERLREANRQRRRRNPREPHEVPHTKTVAETRRLLAKMDSCPKDCPGWDVFDTDRGFEIQVCDECNRSLSEAQRLSDDDVAQLPEAQKALAAVDAEYAENPANDWGVYAFDGDEWQLVEGPFAHKGMAQKRADRLNEETSSTTYKAFQAKGAGVSTNPCGNPGNYKFRRGDSVSSPYGSGKIVKVYESKNVPGEMLVAIKLADGAISSHVPMRELRMNPCGDTPNPRDAFTAKGERMYEDIKAGYGNDPRGPEIAARTVYARAREGVPGLLRAGRS